MPVTLTIIFLLLYLNFRAITETLVAMLSLPFALVDGIWVMWGSASIYLWPSPSASSRSQASRRDAVVMLIYFDHELVEMKTRPNAEGHAFFISRYFLGCLRWSICFASLRLLSDTPCPMDRRSCHATWARARKSDPRTVRTYTSTMMIIEEMAVNCSSGCTAQLLP
ncbi:hypothetical protein XI05_11135 [Bradyrhizobium sp. CCBAU 11357]|nr:hypothetical protein [Bradyrhizobium sp. CCBAU 11357]